MRAARWVCTALWAAVLLASAAPALAFEGRLPDGQVVFGEDFTLAAGETLDGDLVVFGGDVTLEEDSRVDGDVVVWGGDVEVAGVVEGQVAAFGGNVALLETAVIDGDLAVIGGQVSREEGARVRGQQVVNPWQAGRWSTWPMFIPTPPDLPDPLHGLGMSARAAFRFLWRGLRLLLTAALMAGLAGLVTVLWPQAAMRVGRACAQAPLPTFGMGLLTVAVVAALLISICLTVIGLVAVVAVAVAAVFGWLALGILIGERLLEARSVHPFWPAALGAGLLTLLSGLLGLIPCVGWMGSFLIACVGLGAVVLTRFGMQDYPLFAPAQEE